jgi:hypothetical protein
MCRTLELPAGVTVSVPDGWEPMPPASLEAHTAKLARLGRTDGHLTYDCGLQLASAATNNPYPYVLIQTKHTGRVGRMELAEFPVMQKGLPAAFAEFEQALSTNRVGAGFGGFLLDAPANILWMPATVRTAEDTHLLGLLALVLTERGVIHVACYAREADFAAYLPVFETFVRQLRPSPDLLYRPRFSDAHPVLANTNWRSVVVPGVIVLALGAGALFLVRRAGG